MELVRCKEKLHDVDFYKARMEVSLRLPDAPAGFGEKGAVGSPQRCFPRTSACLRCPRRPLCAPCLAGGVRGVREGREHGSVMQSSDFF